MIITHHNDYFEVVLHEEVVCDGYVDILQEGFHDSQEVLHEFRQDEDQDNMFILQKADIYKEFRIKGYCYGDSFQTILRSNLEGMVDFSPGTSFLLTATD